MIHLSVNQVKEGEMGHEAERVENGKVYMGEVLTRTQHPMQRVTEEVMALWETSQPELNRV